MTVYHPRDLQLARRANRAGAKNSLRIILEARRAGILISLAFGLCDFESMGFQNIFGCDKGGLFCHQAVTHAKVLELIRHVRAGGVSNGVGYTQLTSLGYIVDAERQGGAHKVKYQCRVGFKLVAQNIHTYGLEGGLAAYNAGHPGSATGRAYARRVMAAADHWHRVLDPKKA